MNSSYFNSKKTTKIEIKGIVIDSNNVIGMECCKRLQPCHTFYYLSTYEKYLNWKDRFNFDAQEHDAFYSNKALEKISLNVTYGQVCVPIHKYGIACFMNLFATCKPLTLQHRVMGKISDATYEKANPKSLVSHAESKN